MIGVICELFMTDVYSIMQVTDLEPAPSLTPSVSVKGPNVDDTVSDHVKRLEKANRQLRQENEQLMSMLNRTRLRAALPAILRKRTTRRGDGGYI